MSASYQKDIFIPEKNFGDDNCPVGAPSTSCGNPINAGTGNKFQKEVDVVDGKLLGFTRYYNSHRSGPGDSTAAHWTHTFSRSVSAVASSGAFVYRPDGKSYFFANVSGNWVPDPDVTGRLESVVASDGSLTGWTYQAKDGREIEHYDARGLLVSIDYATGDRVTLEYNNGRVEGNANDVLLTRVSAQDGRMLQLQYDSNRRLQKLVDAAGSEYVYTYNVDGLLSSVTYPDTHSKLYLYNEAAHMSGSSFAWALTGIVDEAGQRFATYTYDAAGRAISTEHAGGANKYAVAYATNTNSTITTPSGAVRQLGLVDPNGVRRVDSLAETANGITRNSAFTYDTYGRTDHATDARGVERDYDINARGLQTQLVEDVANSSSKRRTTQTDWHVSFDVPVERRTYDSASALPGALVSRQAWAYNTRGQATASCQIDPANSTAMAYVCGASVNAPAGVRQQRTGYCEQGDVDAGTCPRVGLVTSSDGARSDASDGVQYTYRLSDNPDCVASPATCAWRKGDLWKVSNALGQVTEYLRYDGAGRVLSLRDANGVVTDSEYTPRGWLARRIVRGSNDASEVDDRITTMDYWPTGLAKQVTQPDGSYTHFDYDAAHRLTDISDSAGNRLHYVLDNAGNRVKEETFDSGNVLRRELSRIYNQLGQLQTQANASATPTADYTYDAAGQVDTVTDASGRVTDNDYDALGRLRQTIQDVAGIHAATQFQYDARDNLVRVVDPKGLNTDYDYNGLGELQSLSSPDTGISTYSYDSAGNRKTQTDARGVTASYGYDALNRLVSVSYPDASLNVSYSYDEVSGTCASGETYAAGRLSRITDNSGSTQYCYDRWGQLVSKVQTTAGKVFTLRYGYTSAGRLASVTYPSGARVDLTRNAHGQTTMLDWLPNAGPMQPLIADVSYHAFGPASALVYGDGRTLRRMLDLDYQPDVIEDVGSGGLSLGYGFDDAGNLITLRDGNQSEPPLRHYGYDGLNRLTDVKDGASNVLLQDYGYDATGNRIRSGSTAYTYAADSHRLIGDGNGARSYDEAGNTTVIPAPPQGFSVHAATSQALAQHPTASATGTLTKGQPVSNISIKKGKDAVYTLAVPAGAGGLRFTLSGGSGNADLYVKFGSTPTDTVYDCRPYLSGNAESCSFDSPSVGTYYIRLKARSNVSGVSLVGDYTAAVPNQAPVATFSVSASDLVVNFTDHSTDNDGSIASRAWSFGDGDTSASVNPSHTYAAAGTYVVGLTVTDNAGASTSSSQPVTVSAPSNHRGFGYNDANRMAQVLRGSTVLMSYRYNGKGEQVDRFDGAGAHTFFVYDEAGHVLGQYDSAGHAIQEYLWLDDLPVGVAAAGKVYYVEPDHLGTPRAVIDPDRQKAVWSWPLTGEAFGNTAPNPDADGDGTAFTYDLRFPGQRWDAASGLSYNYYRDYESVTGRYAQSDPIGLSGGISSYAYAESNPFQFSDPTGLAAAAAAPVIEQGLGAAVGVGGGSFCAAVGASVIGILMPANIADTGNCSDDPRHQKLECRDDDDDRCEKAKSDARRLYLDLTLKRIPQYTSGGARGSDPNHYNTILQRQLALRRAVSRVRQYCRIFPIELPEWERIANMPIPTLH